MADTVAAEPALPHEPTRSGRRPSAILVRSIALKFAIYGLNAASGIITARALAPSGRGELAAMILWPVLLSGVTTVGLPSALIYHVRRTPGHAPTLISAALAFGVATSGAATVAGWYLIPVWLQDQSANVVLAAQYCLLATTPYALTLVARAVWEAQGRLDRSHAIQLISPIVTVLALLPQAATGLLTPRAAAATYVLAGVPTVIWAVVSVVRAHRPAIRGLRRSWTSLLHFGTRSCGVDLCAVLSTHLDQALIVGLLVPEAVGLYVVALSVARAIDAIPGSVALAAFARMVGLSRGELGAAIARSARLTALACGVLGLFVIAAGGTLLRWLYGAPFQAAARVLPILVCAIVLAGVAQVLLQGYLASGRPGAATLIQVLALVLGIPIFLVLVPAFGITGAALALLASTILRLALTLAAYPALLGVPVPRIRVGAADMADLHVVSSHAGGVVRTRADRRSEMIRAPLPRLRIFIAHPSELLTDCRSHGDGLVAFSFIRRLAERGHDVHVAAQRVELQSRPPASLHVHRLAPRGDGTSLVDRLRFMVRMRLLFERLRRRAPFDVVHQMNPVFTGISLSLIGVRTPLVLGTYVLRWGPDVDSTPAGLPRSATLRRRLNEVVVRAQQARAAGLLIASPHALARIARPERHRGRIFEVPHGIDLARFAERAAPPARPSVLFLAGVARRKGIFTLLDAFERVAGSMPEAELAIAGGEGGSLADVRSRVAAMKNPKIRLLGAVDRAAVADLMRTHSVYCLPSYGEPFATSILEAMACGVPIVATRAGGIPDLVTELGGRLVPPRDPVALADALVRVLRSTELQRRMGRYNRARVEAIFDAERATDRLEEAYRAVLSQDRSHGGLGRAALEAARGTERAC